MAFWLKLLVQVIMPVSLVGIRMFEIYPYHHYPFVYQIMWTDPIVEELHQIREAHAAKFNYDVHAIGEYFQEPQKLSGRSVVSFARGYPCQEDSARLTEEVTAVSPTFQGRFTLSQEGQLTIENLPFQRGDSVEVMIRSCQ